MSPSLLLEREKSSLRPAAKERLPTSNATKALREVDARTGIRLRCRCANESGRHDESCIYNLV